jgi:MFS transporter, DHA2 family, multidrug resistance protein
MEHFTPERDERASLKALLLTDQWVGEDFLPSQLMQAVGQSFGLTSLVWFALKHLEPSQVFTFGAMLQTGRLFGAELGSAFI